MFAEIQSRFFVSRLRLERTVARLFGSSRLGNRYRQGPAEIRTQLRQNAIHAVRIRVVEEKDGQLIRTRLPQRLGDELRSQSRAADSDQQQILERPRGSLNLAAVNILRECFDGRERILNLLANRW